jgi:argininosuccinate lyase
MSQNFGFITLPDQFTTGSSIMPHKKNPDIFEIIRAKSNKIQAMSNEIMQITNNLTSGYFRDMQILKETYIESFDYLIEILKVTSFIVPQIEVKNNILDDEKYKFAFSVEEVNKLVQKGIPFREAYQKIGNEINQGNFNPDKEISHTHEGSIGNLCNDKIEEKFKNILKTFDFEKINKAEAKLLQL